MKQSSVAILSRGDTFELIKLNPGAHVPAKGTLVYIPKNRQSKLPSRFATEQELPMAKTSETDIAETRQQLPSERRTTSASSRASSVNSAPASVNSAAASVNSAAASVNSATASVNSAAASVNSAAASVNSAAASMNSAAASVNSAAASVNSADEHQSKSPLVPSVGSEEEEVENHPLASSSSTYSTGGVSRLAMEQKLPMVKTSVTTGSTASYLSTGNSTDEHKSISPHVPSAGSEEEEVENHPLASSRSTCSTGGVSRLATEQKLPMAKTSGTDIAETQQLPSVRTTRSVASRLSTVNSADGHKTSSPHAPKAGSEEEEVEEAAVDNQEEEQEEEEETVDTKVDLELEMWESDGEDDDNGEESMVSSVTMLDFEHESQKLLKKTVAFLKSTPMDECEPQHRQLLTRTVENMRKSTMGDFEYQQQKKLTKRIVSILIGGERFESLNVHPGTEDVEGSVVEGSVVEGSVVEGSVVEGSVVEGSVADALDFHPETEQLPNSVVVGEEQNGRTDLQKLPIKKSTPSCLDAKHQEDPGQEIPTSPTARSNQEQKKGKDRKFGILRTRYIEAIRR